MYKLLGADPEIQLRDNHNAVLAAEGCVDDPDRLESFGVDSSGDVAELRPDPSDSPVELVQSIRALLLSGQEQLGLPMFAGTGYSGEHPLGGHIHIGRDINPAVCDKYIGLPLVALEPERGRIWRRVRGGYGYWGDLRRQEWGWEYRTPSSWLVSPAATRFAFALAWLAARNVDVLRKGLPRLNLSLEITERGTSQELIAHAKEALGTLSNLPDYKKVAPLLKPFDFLVEIVGDWGEERDLASTWKLSPPQPLPAARREEEAEVWEEESTLSNIIWNGDRGMREIKEVCGGVPGVGRLWAVGIGEGRGDSIHLSPSLYENKRVHLLLQKHNFRVAKWRAFPSRNGELVIGLPLALRLENSTQAATLVRLVALAVFNRLEEK